MNRTVLICVVGAVILWGTQVVHSQTNGACTHLQAEAETDGSPIVFDKETREYQLKYKDSTGARVSMPIHYCPFCGAKAPQGIRESMWHKVPQDETERLHHLFEALPNFGVIRAKYGEPDSWMATTVGPANYTALPDKIAERLPLEIRRYRVAVYSKLSEVADIQLKLNEDETVHGIAIVPKPVKGPLDGQSPVVRPEQQADGPMIGSLETRGRMITIRSGSNGPLYTVKSKDGTVLAVDLPAGEVVARFPDLKTVVDRGVAGHVWAAF